ncbi:MAG: hypothetical protein M1429_02625, partial [Patescibacteria group bacterium]|nr:hypothetical protein [Patescibacteria group bacterium]
VLFQIALIFDKMSSAACSPFQRQNTPPFLNVRYVKTIADTYTLKVNAWYNIINRREFAGEISI